MSLVMVIPENTCPSHRTISFWHERKYWAYGWPDVDERRECPFVLFALSVLLKRHPASRTHKRPGDVAAKLDGDPKTDDEVDEGDRVQADPPEPHDAHHTCHCQHADGCHCRAGAP